MRTYVRVHQFTDSPIHQFTNPSDVASQCQVNPNECQILRPCCQMPLPLSVNIILFGIYFCLGHFGVVVLTFYNVLL